MYHVLHEFVKYIVSRTNLIAYLPKQEDRDFLPDLIQSISVKILTKIVCSLAKIIETKGNIL
jgi:hypothetical protein